MRTRLMVLNLLKLFPMEIKFYGDKDNTNATCHNVSQVTFLAGILKALHIKPNNNPLYI